MYNQNQFQNWSLGNLVPTHKTEQYHFAKARATGSFEAGGEVRHLTPDGNTMLSHTVTKVTPEKHLDMTFTPGWMPNAESSRVVYEIEDMKGACKLTIMHYDIPADQHGVGDATMFNL